MANYRVQVVAKVNSADLGREVVTNILNYAAPTTTPSAIGNAVLAGFCGTVGPYLNFSSVTVKVYDRANPLHSPPVFTTTPHTGSGITVGPRQVALCLSFYSGLNIRGQRGRIYVGPWPAAGLGEYATAGQMATLITLAGAIQHPGGGDVAHLIWHPKTASWSNVSNYFANNRWDTMRSRLPRETARQTFP